MIKVKKPNKQIKRSTFVEQFEDIVKQEIENHKKEVLNSNIKVNEVKSNIDKIKHEISNIIKEISDKDLRNDILFSHLKSFVIEKHTELEKKVDNKLQSFNDILDDFSNKLDKFYTSFLKKQEFINFKQNYEFDLKFVISNLEDKQSNLKSLFSEKIKQINKNIRDLSDQIDQAPDEITPLRDELLEKINVCKIDSGGIDKKLIVYHKELFICTKKIEKLFNLIEKMQKKDEVKS